MKLTLLAVVVGLFTLSATAFAADAPAPKADDAKSPKGKLFHVVSIKFKDAAKPEQIKAVEEAFKELKNKIPGITSLDWGTNVSPEKNDKGFTHCFVLTFATAKDRDTYLTHPDHKAFGGVLGPVLADVFVLDFWSKE